MPLTTLQFFNKIFLFLFIKLNYLLVFSLYELIFFVEPERTDKYYVNANKKIFSE